MKRLTKKELREMKLTDGVYAIDVGEDMPYLLAAIKGNKTVVYDCPLDMGFLKELPEGEGNTIERIAEHATSGMADHDIAAEGKREFSKYGSNEVILQMTDQEFCDIVGFLDQRRFTIVISG